MGLFVALSPLLLAAGSTAAAECTPIPGWEQAIADPAIRWIVIGEIHGTNEIPAIFADAVCLTARSRTLIVAVEAPSADQGAIDEFIRSDGGAEAKRRFLGGLLWSAPIKDGRSSQAYFNLFETLRQLHADRRIVSVVAFQPSAFAESPTLAGYEKAMAELLRGAALNDATVMALVGNVHAMRTEVAWGNRYLAMAGHLPREATLTFDTTTEGGEAWTCSGRPMACGPSPTGSNGRDRARGVELIGGDGPYSGVIHLGAPITASPPEGASPASGE